MFLCDVINHESCVRDEETRIIAPAAIILRGVAFILQRQEPGEHFPTGIWTSQWNLGSKYANGIHQWNTQ
eukprot:8840234-Karenia_brevis.AAC.1